MSRSRVTHKTRSVTLSSHMLSIPSPMLSWPFPLPNNPRRHRRHLVLCLGHLLTDFRALLPLRCSLNLPCSRATSALSRGGMPCSAQTWFVILPSSCRSPFAYSSPYSLPLFLPHVLSIPLLMLARPGLSLSRLPLSTTLDTTVLRVCSLLSSNID
jgi:hypothetical protein